MADDLSVDEASSIALGLFSRSPSSCSNELRRVFICARSVAVRLLGEGCLGSAALSGGALLLLDLRRRAAMFAIWSALMSKPFLAIAGLMAGLEVAAPILLAPAASEEVRHVFVSGALGRPKGGGGGGGGGSILGGGGGGGSGATTGAGAIIGVHGTEMMLGRRFAFSSSRSSARSSFFKFLTSPVLTRVK